VTLAGEAFGALVEERLRRAAERLLRYPFEAWFYGDSIGFEGLLAASELLGDDRYRTFAYGFLRGWAARDEPRRPDDNTAPGLVLCELARVMGDVGLAAAAERLAAHLAGRRRVRGVGVTFEDARRSLRPPYGPAALPPGEEALLADPGAAVYVDCLHFDPPFYASLAHLEPDGGWAARAIAEAQGYGELLRDPASGLYAHFWLERTGRAYAPGWGRGQGWALLGLLDVLTASPAGEPGCDGLAVAAEALIEAMLRSQRPDGGWHAVVTARESGDETSTAAFMAVAFRRAARLGLADAADLGRGAERAWLATLAALAPDGLLSGVSAAVYSSTQPLHYHHVPRGFDVPWGQGPLLVAALEAARARPGTNG
jgi:unsaturated rhamnogalacturonyl hydrolase